MHTQLHRGLAHLLNMDNHFASVTAVLKVKDTGASNIDYSYSYEPIFTASSVPGIIPYLLLDSSSSDADVIARSKTSSLTHQSRERVFCAYCRQHITDLSEEVEKQGKHIHFHTNPHGFDFRFACYRAAPGCRVLGLATTEHSWFPGHSWQVALCGACNEHLGWLFKGESRFYGLILDRLEVGLPGHT